MPDWTKTMQQSFSYYEVDPGTWKDKKKIENVISSTVSRDLGADTLGSETIDTSASLGECYVRTYLETIQNGVTEKQPLGTFLVQSPSTSFDGKRKSISMDAYTPLLELKEKQPPIGYYVKKGSVIMDVVYDLVLEHARAPVIKQIQSDLTLNKLWYDFVADTEDTWLSFITSLAAEAKFVITLDELGRILFEPKQETASLQPKWTFDDSNSSILYSDIDLEQDLYDVPNVVEVLYSSGEHCYFARAVNDDANSPTSTVSRGREITRRFINPDVGVVVNNETQAQAQVQEYANATLRNLSTLEYTVTYTHGYCPVNIGDCVRLNHKRAGLVDIKAKIISQSIKCEPGCPVTEKAVFTTKLWG